MAEGIGKLSKEHVNITTIGHVDHGKTTLSAAITKYAANKGWGKFVDYKEIDKAPEEKARGITINAAHLELETADRDVEIKNEVKKVTGRHYSLIDCPGHADYVKNMITGASQAEGGILVVAATDGQMPQTREHLRLIRQIGVKHLVVFINKVDVVLDLSMIDLVEMELRDLLTTYGFDGEKTPFIKGSALLALEGKQPELGEESIKDLLDAIDIHIPNPVRDLDKPFLMPIEKAESIKKLQGGGEGRAGGIGTVVTGVPLRGKLSKGKELEIVGFSSTPVRVTVTGIEMHRKVLDQVLPGHDVGILLRGIKREQIRRGQVLAEPGTIKSHTKFKTETYILTKEEGGRHTPFGGSTKEGKKAKSGKEYRPQFFFHTADVTGSISSPKDSSGNEVEMVMPGDTVNFTVNLVAPVAIEPGTSFSIREGGRTVGSGKVTEIIE